MYETTSRAALQWKFIVKDTSHSYWSSRRKQTEKQPFYASTDCTLVTTANNQSNFIRSGFWYTPNTNLMPIPKNSDNYYFTTSTHTSAAYTPKSHHARPSLETQPEPNREQLHRSVKTPNHKLGNVPPGRDKSLTTKRKIFTYGLKRRIWKIRMQARIFAYITRNDLREALVRFSSTSEDLDSLRRSK